MLSSCCKMWFFFFFVLITRCLGRALIVGDTFKSVPHFRLEISAWIGRCRFSQQMRLLCTLNRKINPIKLFNETLLLIEPTLYWSQNVILIRHKTAKCLQRSTVHKDAQTRLTMLIQSMASASLSVSLGLRHEAVMP